MQPRHGTDEATAPDARDRPWVKLLALGGLASVVAAVALHFAWEEPLPPALEWTFSDGVIGADARGLELPIAEGGRWTHEEDDAADDGRVLVNHAAPGADGAALAVAARVRSRGLRVTTRCRAGAPADACGVVVRLHDARHHYLARLEPTRLVLAVVAGGPERELEAVDLEVTRGWHELSVDVVGDRIRIAVDGVSRIDRADSTLPSTGRAGLWSPASGSAAFDSFRVEPLSAGRS